MKYHSTTRIAARVLVPIATIATLFGTQGTFEAFAGTSSPTTGMGSISGKVTSGAAPVANAFVTAWDANNNIVGQAVSGADGTYSVPVPPTGSYAIHADAAGFTETVDRSVVVNNGVGLDNPVLAASGQLTGYVLNAYNNPVPGAAIAITDASGKVVAAATAGVNGYYSIPNIPLGQYTVTATASTYSDFVQSNEWIAGAQTLNFNMSLNYGIVQGTITDTDTKQKVSGASIIIVNSQGIIVGSATSNANGAYSIGNVTPGQYTLQVNAKNYQAVTQSTTITNGQTLQTDVPLKSLASLATTPAIKGTLKDTVSNKPVVGATISVIDGQGNPISTATSGTDGVYSVTGLSSGTYSENITANGYGSASQSGIVVTAGQTSKEDVMLTPDVGKVAGTVYDGKGNPVAGAKLSIVDASGNKVGQEVQTNASGFYTLVGIPTGIYFISAQDPDFADYMGNGVVVSKNNTTIRDVQLSTDFGNLQVKVSDKKTNTPLNATVELEDANGIPVTDSVDVSGQYTFTHVPGGTITVVVNAPGYNQETVTATVSSKQDASANVNLTLGNGTVTGTVTSAFDGSQIAGATVSVLDPSGQLMTSTQTGADGTYTLNDVPSDVTIQVEANGYGESMQSLATITDSTKQDFALSNATPGTITGAVTDTAFNAIPGVTVTLLDDNGEPTGHTTTTDQYGQYSFSNLPDASNYSLQFDASGYVSDTQHNVPVGGYCAEQLVSQAGAVFGTVSTANGTPVTSYTVTLQDAQGNPISQTVSSSSNPTFTFPSIPVGTYSVVVQAPGYATLKKTGQVVSFGKSTTEDLVLSLPSTTVVGSVVDNVTNQPISGATVSLLNAQGKQVGFSLKTTSEGAFQIPNVPIATYTIRVSAVGYQTYTTSYTLPSVGTAQVSPPPILLMSNSVTVKGNIYDQSGYAVIGATVYLVDSKNHVFGTPVKTGANGLYTFNGVPVGNYTVKMIAPYFVNLSFGESITGNTTVPNVYMSPATHMLTGTIRDKNSHSGISNATVVVLDSHGKTVKKTRTSISGTYAMANIPQGPGYVLEIFANGYFVYKNPIYKGTDVYMNPTN